MPLFTTRAFNNHEQVVFCSDPATGLRAIISIHSTALGPAVGGCRFWNYRLAHRLAPRDVADKRAEEDAIFDVLRLSRGMSYKNAMAGLRLGGGKSVIIGDPKTQSSPDLLRRFGAYIERLCGKYYTAEDVGTSPAHMKTIREATNYVVGLEDGDYATGDPSPHTATGVFHGVKAAVRHKMGRDDLTGLTVAIQGVGNVGRYLSQHLRQAGAKLVIADINEVNIERVLSDGPAEVVDPDTIHAVPADVFAPCALGGGLNQRTIPEIKARIVAGAANNQLDDEDLDDRALLERGILYAPDYVINAGGIISVESEVYQEKLDEEQRSRKVLHIAETLAEVFQASDKTGRPTGIIANQLAEQRITAARQARAEAAE